MLYDYLVTVYGENEPIFISDLTYEDLSKNNIRQQIKKLTDAGRLKRYDTGIYFIPKKSIFKSGTQLSLNTVLEKKNLQCKEEPCGYITGLSFANQLGITTQVPMAYEVATNKATSDYRETVLVKTRVILRKPKAPVNGQNYRILQFLDLMKDIDDYAESRGEELKKRLYAYLKKSAILFSDLEQYLRRYPDKIYRNLFETGLLYGIPS